MALLNFGDDPWLLEHQSCEKLQRDIMELLSLRQQHPRSSDKYNQLSANVRLRLKQFNNEVSQLHVKLNQATKTSLITAPEAERRTRQVEVLHSKAIQMQTMFDEQVSNKLMAERADLMGRPSSSIWADHVVEQPKPDYSQRSVDDLKSHQKTMLGEQERGLESLSQIISRQKDIAQNITNEVDLHNEILEDLGTHIDRTDQRVRAETSHITVVDTKDKTCAYWVIIILLFISIITVAAI